MSSTPETPERRSDESEQTGANDQSVSSEAPTTPLEESVTQAAEQAPLPPSNPAPSAAPVADASATGASSIDTTQTEAAPYSQQPQYQQPQYQQPQYAPTQQLTNPGYDAYGQPVYQPADLGQPADAGQSGSFGQQADPGQQTSSNGRSRRGLGTVGRTVGIAVLVSALVGGGAGAAVGWKLSSNGSSAVTSGSSSNVVINNPEQVTDVTAAAAKAAPSVVTISASTNGEEGTGSGVILDTEGHIVTNNHVVTLDGATNNATLSVTLSDGSIYDAKVVGTDSTTDLAVIQISGASNLTPITIADSSALNVGDLAVAIGAPQGLENTVTSGIVSALNRAISLSSSEADDSDSGSGSNGESNGGGGYNYWNDFGSSQGNTQSTSKSIYLSVIQTDAAINPGNSGGPLVNASGELIGINVAIATASSSTSDSSSAGSIGLGFSIPANVVSRVTSELISDGTAQHGQLGATVTSATADEGATGALIKGVTSGGPAEAAGLKEGDIITKVDNVRITGSDHLIGTVRQSGPGTKITVEYLRDGQTQTTEVTLTAATE